MRFSKQIATVAIAVAATWTLSSATSFAAERSLYERLGDRAPFKPLSPNSSAMWEQTSALTAISRPPISRTSINSWSNRCVRQAAVPAPTRSKT